MATPAILNAIPHLLSAPSNQIWSNYDPIADVLYLSFRKPQNANDSTLEDNIIYHYYDETLVGLTILNAGHYHAETSPAN